MHNELVIQPGSGRTLGSPGWKDCNYKGIFCVTGSLAGLLKEMGWLRQWNKEGCKR